MHLKLSPLSVQEEQNRGKPNWEHLNEDLHVLITVEDAQNRAEIKLKRAVEEVNKLLVPAVSTTALLLPFSSFLLQSSLEYHMHHAYSGYLMSYVSNDRKWSSEVICHGLYLGFQTIFTHLISASKHQYRFCSQPVCAWATLWCVFLHCLNT